MKSLRYELTKKNLYILLMVAIVTIAIITYQFYKNEVKKIEHFQTQELNANKHYIRGFIKNIETKLKTMTRVYDQENSILSSIVKFNPNILKIEVLNKEKKLINYFSSIENEELILNMDYSKREFINKLKNQNSCWSEIINIYDTNEQIIHYSLKYKDKIFITTIHVNKFLSDMISKKNLNNFYTIRVFNKKGYMIFNQQNFNYVHYKLNFLKSETFTKLINKKKEHQYSFFKNLDGFGRYGSYVKIDKLNWIIVAVEEKSFIISELIQTLLPTLFAFIITMLFMTYIMAKSIGKINAAIRLLITNTNNISNGKYEKFNDLKKLNFREFRKLGLVFNSTVNNLLEQKLSNQKYLKDFITLFDNAKSGACLIDKEGKIVKTNQSLRKIIAEKEEFKIKSKNIFTFICKEDKEYLISKFKKNEEVFEFKTEILNQNGETKICLLDIKNIDEIFNCEKIIFLIDITELQRKEDILTQQTKLASMGEMINNIAHQWRQPLSTISVGVSGLKIQNDFGTLKNMDKKTLDDILNNIVTNTQYLSETIDNFRNYFKTDKAFVNFRIKNLIKESLEIFKTTLIKNDIRLVKEYDNNLYIKTFKHELLQVIINIINNAKDALKDINDNEIKIIKIKTYKKHNVYYLEILDNAGGVPEKIKNKIFEPYFTTKHKSNGTGIGLYMSHQIITDHLNGSLMVENKYFMHENVKYYGACFTISLLDENESIIK